MKASRTRNRKLNIKKKSRKNKQKAGAGAGEEGVLSGVLSNTLLDEYTNKFKGSIKEVYGFSTYKSKFSPEDTEILDQMFRDEEKIKKARDKLIKTAIKAETNMSISTIATHGSLIHPPQFEKVPDNIILCLRSYYGKAGLFDLVKEDKQYTDIWNTMVFETKKNYFTKNIKLTTDVKYDTQDDIMNDSRGKATKYINCSRYSSWYYPTQQYYDIKLSVDEGTSSKLVKSKNAWSILITTTKAADPSVKIFDEGETININIGQVIPVQKIQIGENIRYIFNNTEGVEFKLSEALTWINSQVGGRQVLVICECCLVLTKKEEDYKILTYNFITQAFNNNMAEYSLVSPGSIEKQICLNPESETVSLSMSSKINMLFDEHYFTEYNPLLSPYIIKFYNFINNYLLASVPENFDEGENEKILLYFIQALDGVTIGLFSLTLNVLDKLLIKYKE